MSTFVMVLKIVFKVLSVVIPLITGIKEIAKDENGKRLIKNRANRRGVN